MNFIEEYEDTVKRMILNTTKPIYHFKECDDCINKSITNGCMNCRLKKLEDGISALNINIVTREPNSLGIFIFNKKYEEQIRTHGLINLLNDDDYKWTSHLDDDTVGIYFHNRVMSNDWRNW